jgi:hypothetical protein
LVGYKGLEGEVLNDDMTKVVTPKAAGLKLAFPPPGILLGDTVYIPLLPALPILPAFFLPSP